MLLFGQLVNIDLAYLILINSLLLTNHNPLLSYYYCAYLLHCIEEFACGLLLLLSGLLSLVLSHPLTDHCPY